MRRAAFLFGASALVVSFSLATEMTAAIFNWHPALGRPSFVLLDMPIYPPWQVILWDLDWSAAYPKPFALARLAEICGVAAAFLGVALTMRARQRMKPFGQDGWGAFHDAEQSQLFASTGVVLGKLDGEVLCFDGPEHQLLIGGSRSGKGRGQVVPTLLAWPQSALVLDVKGELADGDARVDFPGTAGFREQLGPVLRFAPTQLDSACFNPLLEVRKGPNEVRDVQNIVEILVDPAGVERRQDFWDRFAKHVLVGVVLHVLYAEPLERKTLAVVREKLRDLDATAQIMRATFHRRHPITGEAEVHPEVLHAAESFLAGEERLQSGVKATAESFFGIFADEIIAAKTATSDFRVGDLMCGPEPVTLYVQPPPSDALRLTPLLRLIINQFARALMEDQGADTTGRAKRHRLLLMLDEFPLLGRMPFFETMMGAMAGYGLKAFLVCQSLNHLTKAYGRDNVILDNCHIVTAFAASDGDTAKRIADMAGDVWELRESHTHKVPRAILGWRSGSTTIREERRPLLSPADVRAMPRDEAIIFVSGAKPIRAKKLRFDLEPVFRARLRSSLRQVRRLTTSHDWHNVEALGRGPVAPSSWPGSKPAQGQPDLFAQDGATETEIIFATRECHDQSRVSSDQTQEGSAPPSTPPVQVEKV